MARHRRAMCDAPTVSGIFVGLALSCIGNTTVDSGQLMKRIHEARAPLRITDRTCGDGKRLVNGFLQFGVPCKKNSGAVAGGTSKEPNLQEWGAASQVTVC